MYPENLENETNPLHLKRHHSVHQRRLDIQLDANFSLISSSLHQMQVRERFFNSKGRRGFNFVIFDIFGNGWYQRFNVFQRQMVVSPHLEIYVSPVFSPHPVA